MSPARHHHALPEGYSLHWYEIDSILGQGGFGITYLARDTNLDQPVAIKEFLPSDLATRTQDSKVQPLNGGHTDTYGWGLNRFLTEARTLAKFRHPNIVRVMSVFEANNTAYMIMEYERGESFENMLKFKQVSGEETLKRILLALLDGLELVHDAGFIHRDIKPSNVYLREDGVPVLLDFGSARLALGVETRTLTSLVSPGYAPFEQYNATRESDKQGPWTDIYALGATMYRAVTGQGPVDAAARANLLLDEQRDPYQPCSQLTLDGYSPAFLNAIDCALAFTPADRPQSVAAWRQLVVAEAVDQEAATLAVGAAATSIAGVDIVLDGDDDHEVRDGRDGQTVPLNDTTVRTVPLAELDAAAQTATTQSSGRGWFIATSVVAVIGIAVVAWLTLAPGGREGAAVPAPTTLAAATPESQSAAAPAVESAPQAAAGQSADDTTAPEPSRKPVPQPLITESVAVATERNAATASSAAASKSEVTPQEASIGEAAEALPVTREAQPANASPAEPPAADKSAEKVPAPAPAPKKTTPEKVTKAAPAKKASPATPTAKKTTAKKTTAKKPSQPRTREEKVAAHLASGDAHLQADRLTKPKKQNALRDYLTALAMDTDNAAARRGVERIVERYLVKAEKATGAREYENARDYLHQARFVLDAMKLRKWPKQPYKALFDEYLAATRHLAASR